MRCQSDFLRYSEFLSRCQPDTRAVCTETGDLAASSGNYEYFDCEGVRHVVVDGVETEPDGGCWWYSWRPSPEQVAAVPGYSNFDPFTNPKPNAVMEEHARWLGLEYTRWLASARMSSGATTTASGPYSYTFSPSTTTTNAASWPVTVTITITTTLARCSPAPWRGEVRGSVRTEEEGS